jgi:hypothetical protein
MRHQIKSKWYYIFWGVCAVAVVGGQVYVATGYREWQRQQKILKLCVSESEKSKN